jgi:hypothetical protein
METKKKNKYIYGYALYVNYGYGWEYETFEYTRAAALAQLRCYRENCPQYAARIAPRRELNN